MTSEWLEQVPVAISRTEKPSELLLLCFALEILFVCCLFFFQFDCVTSAHWHCACMFAIDRMRHGLRFRIVMGQPSRTQLRPLRVFVCAIATLGRFWRVVCWQSFAVTLKLLYKKAQTPHCVRHFMYCQQNLCAFR